MKRKMKLELNIKCGVKHHDDSILLANYPQYH